jgi:hypothetical protein
METLVTEQGVNMTRAAAENVREAGIDVMYDVMRYRGTSDVARVSREALLAECLNDADDDRAQGWHDYVDAIAAQAEAEEAYVTVTSGGGHNGFPMRWFAVLVDPTNGEPIETGVGRWPTRAEAVVEARDWAMATDRPMRDLEIDDEVVPVIDDELATERARVDALIQESGVLAQQVAALLTPVTDKEANKVFIEFEEHESLDVTVAMRDALEAFLASRRGAL